MIKVLVVFGTRPEAVKMCPLVNELNKSKSIDCKVCLTAQHRGMLDQVINTFRISIDYDLNIMKQNQTLSNVTIAVLNGVNDVIGKENPDLILVHGDTTTSFAASLSAFYNHVPIGHVEAGLRTYNLQSPYPEEFNRQSVDIMADYFFAPTEAAKNRLLKEGKNEKKVFVTGNTVIDALKSTISSDYTNKYLEWAEGSKLLLLTAHRRENIGEPMEAMFKGIQRVVEDNKNVKVIFPCHKNPKVKELASKYFAGHKRIRLIEPLDVYDFHNFMNRSYFILTDSGGIQEEAPALGKPVLVMRDTTERPEGIAAGTVKLVGTSEDSIYKETCKLLNDKNSYEEMSHSVNPYGDGHASERIVNIIKEINNRGNIHAETVIMGNW